MPDRGWHLERSGLVVVGEHLDGNAGPDGLLDERRQIGRLATETVDGDDGGLVGVSGVDIEQRAAAVRVLQRNAYLRSADTVGHRTGIYGHRRCSPCATDSARKSAGQCPDASHFRSPPLRRHR